MVHAHEIMRTDYIVADINDTVSELIGQMEKHNQREAVVFDGRTYKGLASKKWLLSSRIDPRTMKVRNLMTHRSKSKTPFFVPILTPETEIEEIARLLATADVHALPVITKNKVVGIVRSLDVISAIRNAYKSVKTEELSSDRLITINQDEELGKAINLMSKKGIGHIVVVDDAGKLIGILSLTDILTEVHKFPRTKQKLPRSASHQKGKHAGFGTGEKDSILNLSVHDIITHVPNCYTVSPKDPLTRAIDEMTEHEVSSVVLMEKDKPVGIITIKDILEDYAKT